LSPELTSGSDSLMSSELEMASDSFMSPPSSFMAGLDGESSPLASLLDRSLGEEADSLAFPEAAAADQAQAEVKENVFGQKVDSDIDDIFSELAPPEAQKEVAETKAAKKPEPVEEPAHEDMMPTFSASESLFGSNVDGDIDNIFSELAPEAAQDKLESAPATTHSAAATTEIAMPEAAPAAVPVAEEAEEEPAEPAGSLFDGGLEAEIDDIFSELAPPEAQKEVKDRSAAAAQAEPVKAEAKSEDFTPAAAAAEAKAQAEPEPEPEADAEAAEGGLFGDDLGQELDNIFSGLTESAQLEVTASTLAKVKSGEGVAEEPVAAQAQTVPPVVEKPAPVVEAPAAPAASAAAPAKPEAPKYKEVKEFGRLSAKPTTTAKFAGDTGGTMKTIGKLLLDVQAVENIIKSGETKKIGSGLSTAKIISAARGEGIKNILNAIDTYEGVAGSLIVGHDGLVIASTVGTGWDKDMLGALSTALLSTSNLATKKLEIGKLRQMVMLTGLSNGDGQQFKTTVLTDVDVGILAVFLEKTDLQKIDGLLETIQTTIHGG
jgi:predicted regulator of Ras-like GTPase activity (Roadblock/LC7/MglB family)